MLIGLVGKPHSGKSEVRFILENLGFQTVNVKLPMARACHELTGIPLDKFLSQDGKASLYKGIPIRNIMGRVQAAIEELFGDYHTIEAALQGYDTTNEKLVVDSLRKTQPDYFTGIVVEVVSNNSIDTGNDFDVYSRKKIDYTLQNNGSLGELEVNIIKMLDELGVRI